MNDKAEEINKQFNEITKDSEVCHIMQACALQYAACIHHCDKEGRKWALKWLRDAVKSILLVKYICNQDQSNEKGTMKKSDQEKNYIENLTDQELYKLLHSDQKISGLASLCMCREIIKRYWSPNETRSVEDE